MYHLDPTLTIPGVDADRLDAAAAAIRAAGAMASSELPGCSLSPQAAPGGHGTSFVFKSSRYTPAVTTNPLERQLQSHRPKLSAGLITKHRSGASYIASLAQTESRAGFISLTSPPSMPASPCSTFSTLSLSESSTSPPLSPIDSNTSFAPYGSPSASTSRSTSRASSICSRPSRSKRIRTRVEAGGMSLTQVMDAGSPSADSSFCAGFAFDFVEDRGRVASYYTGLSPSSSIRTPGNGSGKSKASTENISRASRKDRSISPSPASESAIQTGCEIKLTPKKTCENSAESGLVVISRNANEINDCLRPSSERPVTTFDVH